MFKMKKLLSMLLTLGVIASMGTSAFAQENSEFIPAKQEFVGVTRNVVDFNSNPSGALPARDIDMQDTESKDILVNNTIILRTEEDWAKMRQHDLAEYNAKLANISPMLKKDVSTFLNNHNELAAMPYSKHSAVVSNEYFLTQFMAAYPEYAGNEAQIAVDVATLRANPVVVAVRAFFSSKGYDLALDLFNHSLTENPATASLSLTGNTEGMYGHIRSELTADPFLDKMKTFANKSGTEKLSDSSYTFDNGDLYWDIHGFTWTRSRTSKGVASFAIDDVYDFNKWKDIPGIVAGLAGTHDFDVHIGGLVQNGAIK